MKKRQIYRATKLLLFPRSTTIWDLFLMLSESSINLKEILKDPYNLGVNLRTKLIHLTLRHLKSLVKKSPERIIINSNDLSYWLRNSSLILNTLIKLEEKESARALAFNFISTLFFLITVYVMKNINSNSEMLEFLDGFKFDEDAIKTLISVFNNKDWEENLTKLNIIDIFNLLTSFYSISIKKILEHSNIDTKKKIFALIEPFLKFSDEKELLKLLDKVINLVISEKDSLLIRIIISSLTILIEGLSREILKTSDSTAVSYLKKFLEKIISFYSLKDLYLVYRDFNVLGLETCVKILYDIINNDIDSALKTLNKLGHILLQEKTNLIGITEHTILKLPPETFSLTPPLTPPPIELRDRLSSSALLMIINEILDEVISSSIERKNILKSALILAPNNFKKFLFKAIVDPISSLALMFLIGIPSVLLFETIIFITAQRDEKFSAKIISTIIDTLNVLLSAKKKILEHLEKKYFHDYPEYIELASFYVYRDIFFISLLMTDKTRQKLLRNKYGKKLIKILDDIYNYLEKIYGRAPIVKREDISELFA